MPTQISVCMFKRVATECKADGWERGVAFIRAGDVDFIVDKDGKKIKKVPNDWLRLPEEGSFITDLELET